MSTKTALRAFTAALFFLVGVAGCLEETNDLDQIEQAVALPPPTGLTVTVFSTTGMRLTWNPSPGATKYIILRGTAPGNETNFTSAPAAPTTFSYNHLLPNTTYCWQVKNVNATQELSGPSNEVCASTGTAPLPPPPANVVATAISASRITVTWNAVAGATAYLILGAPAGNPLVQVGSVGGATTTFTHANLAPATTYNYVVRAVTSAGTTGDSAPIATATTFAQGLELQWKFETFDAVQRKYVSSMNDTSGFNRTATLAGGAAFVKDRPNVLDDAYAVQLPAGTTSAITRANASAFNLGSPFTVSLWVKAVAAGDLKIMGMRNAGCGSLGWEIAQNAANGLYFAGETGGIRSFGGALPVGEWVHLAATQDGATLRLYRNGVEVFSGAFGVGNHLALPLTIGHVGGCAGAEIVVDEVQLLSRVMSAAEISAIGDLPDAPTTLQITSITSTRMDLSWTAVPNTAKYIIYHGTAPGNEVFLTSSPAASTTYSYGHLLPGTPHSWQVAAVVGTLISPRSNEVLGTTLSGPGAPQNVTATATSSTRIRVDWTAVPTAVRYYVEQSTGGGGFTPVATVTTNTATIAVASGTTYSYRLRAQDAGNIFSPYSATATATTP